MKNSFWSFCSVQQREKSLFGLSAVCRSMKNFFFSLSAVCKSMKNFFLVFLQCAEA